MIEQLAVLVVLGDGVGAGVLVLEGEPLLTVAALLCDGIAVCVADGELLLDELDVLALL